MTDDGRGARLDDDGINPIRALILQAYYGLRRVRSAEGIGAPEILQWIEAHEPDCEVPSSSLIQLTLAEANVPHRGRGRPQAEETGHPFRVVRADPPRKRTGK